MDYEVTAFDNTFHKIFFVVEKVNHETMARKLISKEKMN